MTGMGDFRKYAQYFKLISREKILARKYLAKKKSRTERKKGFKAYKPGKIRRTSGKKILSPEISHACINNLFGFKVLPGF